MYIFFERIKKKLKLIFLLLPFLLLYGCSGITDNPPTKSFLFGDTVTVAFDQTVVNDNENIRLHFSKLISEERCPVDSECFWEGNAEVRFEFFSDGTKSVFSLNTFSGYTRDTTIAPYRIRMIGLAPWPHSNEYLFPGQYRAQIVILRSILYPVPPY